MRQKTKPVSWTWFLLFAALFCGQVIPNIFNDSPTPDEPLDLTDGYFYWKGDVLTDGSHPVFLKMLQALPFQVMDIKKPPGNMEQDPQLRAYDFFFILNKDKFEKMLFPGRFLTLLFGLGTGLLLFFITIKGSPITLISALALWAFEPTFLAFSSQSGSDIGVTFFILLTVLSFRKHQQNPAGVWGYTTGLLFGMSVCSKFYSLFLVPGLVLLEGVVIRQYSKGRQSRHIEILFMDWIRGAIAFWFFVGLVYLPGTVADQTHPWPFVLFFKNFASVLSIFPKHHPSYFLATASRQSHWFYFPIAFAIKTTIPFVILGLALLAGGISRKISFPPWLWIPPSCFLLFILPVQNMGIRYLLPSFPFLILMGAFLAEHLWNWRPSWGIHGGKLLVSGLLMFHCESALAQSPHFMSYFNELVPSERKVFFLGDSNLDMGQDVKRLAETAKQRGWGTVKLALFGGAVDPSVYGMKWNYWTKKDLAGPQPGQVYAVNMFLLQLGPIFVPSLKSIAESWVISTPPTGRVGDSWIFFEIPGKAAPDPSTPIPSVSVF